MRDTTPSGFIPYLGPTLTWLPVVLGWGHPLCTCDTETLSAEGLEWRSVGGKGRGLTLWTLQAGAVEGLQVQPLAVLAPGAGGGLGALAAPPHGAVGAARRPFAPLTPASVYWNRRGWKAWGR